MMTHCRAEPLGGPPSVSNIRRIVICEPPRRVLPMACGNEAMRDTTTTTHRPTDRASAGPLPRHRAAGRGSAQLLRAHLDLGALVLRDSRGGALALAPV